MKAAQNSPPHNQPITSNMFPHLTKQVTLPRYLFFPVETRFLIIPTHCAFCLTRLCCFHPTTTNLYVIFPSSLTLIVLYSLFFVRELLQHNRSLKRAVQVTTSLRRLLTFGTWHTVGLFKVSLTNKGSVCSYK
jgi:hypothetical protein